MIYAGDLETSVLPRSSDLHLREVLRVGSGSPITIANGLGLWREATVLANGVEPSGPVVLEPAPRRPVTVGIALSKSLDVVVRRLTEVGADRICLLEAERCAVRWTPAEAEKRLTQLNTVIREAGTQSRRARLPALRAPVPLQVLSGQPGMALAEPDGEPIADQVGILIGPESGWTPDELASASLTVGLGDLSLTLEAAAVAAAVELGGGRRGHA